MNRPNPRNNPISIDGDTWYYENRGRIDLIHWLSMDGRRMPITIKIPWKSLMESAKRCRPEQVK